MKTRIFPTYGIAQSAAALALRTAPDVSIKIDPIAIGFILTVTKPMRAKPVLIRLPIKRGSVAECTQVHKEVAREIP